MDSLVINHIRDGETNIANEKIIMKAKIKAVSIFLSASAFIYADFSQYLAKFSNKSHFCY